MAKILLQLRKELVVGIKEAKAMNKEEEIRKEYEELRERGIIRTITIFDLTDREALEYIPKPLSIEEMERAVIEGRKEAARLKKICAEAHERFKHHPCKINF